MSTYVYDDDVDEDEEVTSSVEWVRSYLESNPVLLFNAEFLAKISNDAEKNALDRLLLDNIKTRCRYNNGINFKQVPWYKQLQNPLLLIPESYPAREFQRRYRLPYPSFLELVDECKEVNIFNMSNPYSTNLKIPIELKILIALRMLGRDLCCDDVYEMSFVPISSCNKFYKQFIKGITEKLYSKYVYIPEGNELHNILRMYQM